MGLASKRFAAVQRLESASRNSPPIKMGESGEGVRVLQLAFMSLEYPMPISTKNYTQEPDGIFGAETFSAVKTFQGRNGLQQDGIVGRDTLGKLDQLFSAEVKNLRPACGNCYRTTAPSHPASLIQAALGASHSTGTGGAQLPTGLRFMTTPEENKAKTVFGNSLVFSKILISDGLGLNGRAFVTTLPPVAVPGPLNFAVVNWGPSPDDGTFFHELTHVWQSQHHVLPGAFMVNALASQGVAEVFGGSAYAFIPGRLFIRYGAEQTAQQVERGKADIINHVRAFPPLVPDPTNIPAPGIPFWETPGAPGVET